MGRFNHGAGAKAIPAPATLASGAMSLACDAARIAVPDAACRQIDGGAAGFHV